MSRLAAMLSMHGKIAGLALLPLIIWGSYRMTVMHKAALLIDTVEIAVEHTKPAAVAITRSLGGTKHLIDIGNESDETISVSVPETWERDEVRNVRLADITMEAASFGFRRWTLPVNAIITFRAPREWNELHLHNPSGLLLRARIKTVDLQNNRTETNSYLLQEQDLSVHFSGLKQ